MSALISGLRRTRRSTTEAGCWGSPASPCSPSTSKEERGLLPGLSISLHKKGAAAAAAVVRGLADAELAKSGTVFTGLPPMSAEEMVKRALLGHIDEHFGSIRKAIGG